MDPEPVVVFTVPPEQAQTEEARCFQNAMVVSNSETRALLERLGVTRREQGQHANAVFQKALEYTGRVSLFKNESTMENARHMLLETYRLTEYEAGQMMNLAPETEDDAVILIPSLKDETRFKESDVYAMVEDLAQLRAYEPQG